jgi:hypothetical protein
MQVWAAIKVQKLIRRSGYPYTALSVNRPSLIPSAEEADTIAVLSGM